MGRKSLNVEKKKYFCRLLPTTIVNLKLLTDEKKMGIGELIDKLVAAEVNARDMGDSLIKHF